MLAMLECLFRVCMLLCLVGGFVGLVDCLWLRVLGVVLVVCGGW